MTPRSKTPRYSRAYDAMRRNHNYRALRDGTITRRKLEALQALGYSMADLGRRMGRTQQSLSDTFRVQAPVHIETVKAVDRLYDELSGITPSGHYAHRTRLRAQRLGYAAPACWDDVNDPTERAKGALKA